MSENYSKTNVHSLYARQHVHSKLTAFDGSVISDTSDDRYLNYSATDFFNGTKNPNWRNEVRAGIGASTPASGVKHKIISYEPYSYSAEWKGTIFVNAWKSQTESGYGNPPYGFPPEWTGVPSDIITNTNNRAIQKFLAAADSARSSIEFGQDLGEWKETINGLRHPMNSMRKLVTDTLTGFKGKAFRRWTPKHSLHKAVADTYLEWTFGWKPLAADVGSLIADAMLNYGHPQTQRISSSATGHGSSGVEATGEINFGGKYVRTFRSSFRGTYTRKLIGGIQTGAVGGSLSASKLLQLDAEHFLPTIWDLIPYSFVADYFVNIGEVINALSFRYSDLTWGNDTALTVSEVLYSDTGKQQVAPQPGESIVFEQWSGGNARLQTRSFSRAPMTYGSLLPQLTFKFPTSGGPWENLSFIALAQAANKSIASQLAR